MLVVDAEKPAVVVEIEFVIGLRDPGGPHTSPDQSLTEPLQRFGGKLLTS